MKKIKVKKGRKPPVPRKKISPAPAVLPFTPPSQEFDDPWRSVSWCDDERNKLLRTLDEFQPVIPDVTSLKILMYGPVGSGKSSFINSVNNSLQGRNALKALTDSTTGTSFTLENNSYKVKKVKTGSYYPFKLIDTRGMEQEGGSGIRTEDVIKILKGHIKDNYTFNPCKPISKDDPKYNSQPTMKDKTHCLVGILPMNTIAFMGDDVFKQMRDIREKARKYGIPQVIIMTKADEACLLVRRDLRMIFKSKKIKQMMELCSAKVGVPMNCIFPVKNYHEEDDTNSNMDILILKAILNCVHFANDFLEDQIDSE